MLMMLDAILYSLCENDYDAGWWADGVVRVVVTCL